MTVQKIQRKRPEKLHPAEMSIWDQENTEYVTIINVPSDLICGIACVWLQYAYSRRTALQGCADGERETIFLCEGDISLKFDNKSLYWRKPCSFVCLSVYRNVNWKVHDVDKVCHCFITHFSSSNRVTAPTWTMEMKIENFHQKFPDKLFVISWHCLEWRNEPGFVPATCQKTI